MPETPGYACGMAHHPRLYTFPLPWSLTLYSAFDTHWTQRARADRIARQQARDTLRRLAPTLTVPPGHVVDVEFVFIPPGRRALNAVRLSEHVAMLRCGFADALGCEVWHFYPIHRVSKVPTPNGEVLVRLSVVPIKGFREDR